MGKKKLKLEFEHDLESHVFGIATHLKDYRLIWFLNKDMGYSFKRIDDVMFSANASKPDQAFSIYKYCNEVDHLEYFLLCNKCENGMLIPTLKAASFFMLINGYIPHEVKQDLIKQLRKVRNVLTVYEVEIDQHKRLNDLIDHIEIHLIELKKKENSEKKKRFNINDLNIVKDDTNLPKN